MGIEPTRSLLPDPSLVFKIGCPTTFAESDRALTLSKPGCSLWTEPRTDVKRSNARSEKQQLNAC